jgi:AcrR family transcriptional regulator
MYSTIMYSTSSYPRGFIQYNTGVDLKGQVGRARDTAIDVRVLAVANRHLSRDGYDGMSISAVAQEAGTTRQALYRRWPTKADLAAAVIGSIEDPGTPSGPHEGPLATLVAELEDFVRGISMPGRISLVGAMLQETADPGVVERYQARIIAPRRARIMGILREAHRLELIDGDADLDVAVTMCTGSWYGRALAGETPPTDWPQRAALLVWRAVGGR